MKYSWFSNISFFPMSDENLQTRCNRWGNCVVLLDFSYPIALISWVILILFTKYVSQTQFYFSDVMNILTKSYVWFDRKIVCRKSYKDRIFGIYVIIDFTNVRNFQAASSTVMESWTFNAKTMWGEWKSWREFYEINPKNTLSWIFL